MDDFPRHHESLPRCKFHRAAFEINQQHALDDIKELIIVIVFVPMIFALHNPYAHNRVVHLAKRLVEPLVVARVFDGVNVDDLQRSMQEVEAGFIGEGGCGLGHDLTPRAQHSSQVRWEATRPASATPVLGHLDSASTKFSPAPAEYCLSPTPSSPRSACPLRCARRTAANRFPARPRSTWQAECGARRGFQDYRGERPAHESRVRC